jgi:hypothetical protein
MVEFINFRGQQLPYIYNYFVISKVYIGTSKDISELELLEKVLYYGIMAGCWETDMDFIFEKNGKKREITFKDCAFILSELGKDELKEMTAKFVAAVEESKKK